jgi:NAD-dependent deacetylase
VTSSGETSNGRQPVAVLADSLAALGDGLLLVVTGAGISRASGIPTFRGSEPGAVWKVSDVTMATFDYFRRDPVGQWQWYLARFDAVGDAQPNAAHCALVDLQRWFHRRGGRCCIVTQNIDTLHERAGTEDLIKVHGTADRVRCSRPGCRLGAPEGSIDLAQVDFTSFRTAPSREHLPRCPACNAFLRAHVLFFDEVYLEHDDYRFSEAERLADEADAILFIGTSFSVGITDLYLRSGVRRGAPMLSIDPAMTAPPGPGLEVLTATAEDLLPAVYQRLVQIS